jgi:hypothetical protein
MLFASTIRTFPEIIAKAVLPTQAIGSTHTIWHNWQRQISPPLSVRDHQSTEDRKQRSFIFSGIESN